VYRNDSEKVDLLNALCAVVGRQNTAWTLFDYIPTNWTDPSGAVGLPTREASRTLEVCFSPQFLRVLVFKQCFLTVCFERFWC
jgi:hypothetical protein